MWFLFLFLCVSPVPTLSCFTTSSAFGATTTATAATGTNRVAGGATPNGAKVIPLAVETAETTTVAGKVIPLEIEPAEVPLCDAAGPTVVKIAETGTDFQSIDLDTTTNPATKKFTCKGAADDTRVAISLNRDMAGVNQGAGTVATTLECGANEQWQLAGVDITEVECQVFAATPDVKKAAVPLCDAAGPTVVKIAEAGTDFHSIDLDTTTNPATKKFTCKGAADDTRVAISLNRDLAGVNQGAGTVTTTLECGANEQWQLAGVDITEVECQVFAATPDVKKAEVLRCDTKGPTVVTEGAPGTAFKSIKLDRMKDPATMKFTCEGPATDSDVVIGFNQAATPRPKQDSGKVVTTLECGANGMWQLAGEDITEIACLVFPPGTFPPLPIEPTAPLPCDRAGPTVVIEGGLGTDFELIALNAEVDPPTLRFTCTAPAANSFTIISFNRQTTRLVQNHDTVSTTLTCAANGQWQVAGEHITEIGCNVVPLDIPVVIENNARRPCDMAGPQVVIEPGLGTDFESIAHNVEVDPPTMTFTCTAPAANSFTIISFNRQTTRLVQNHDKVSTTLTCAANGQWQVAGEHITEIGCNVVPLDIPVVIENNARRPCDMAGPQVVIEPGLGTDFESIAHNVEVDPPTMTFTCTAPAANSFTIISFNRQTTRLVQNHDTVSSTLTCAANGQWQVAGEHITEIGCNVVPLDIPVVIEINARRPCDMAGPQVVIEPGLGTDFESIAHNVEVDPPTMTFTCTAPAANSFTIISFNRQTTRLVQNHDKVSTTLTCAANGQWQVAGEHITEIGCNVVPLDIPVVIENNARRPCDMAGPQVVIEPGLGTDFESIAHNVEVDPPTMTFTCTAPAANSFTIISFNRQTTRLVQNHDKVSTTLTCAANGQWQVAGEHITEIGCNVVPLDIPVVIENNARRPCDMAGPQVVIEPGLGTDFESIAHNVEVDPPTMTFTCTAPAANSFTIISFNRQTTRLVQNHDKVSTTLTCAANGQWQVAGEHITEIGCNVVPLDIPVVIENNARRPCDMAGPQVVIEPGLGTDFESIAHNVEVDPPTMTFTCTAPAANSFTIISFNRQTTRLVQNHDKVSTTLTCAANGQWQVAGEHITEIGCNVVPLDIPVVIENNARRPCDMAGPQVVIEPGLGTDFESIAHNVEVDPPTMTFTCTAPAANSFTIISFNRQTTRLVQNHDKVSTTLTCAVNGQWQVAGEHITEIGCNVVPLDIPVVIENNARRPCDMAGPQVVIEPGLGTDFESIAHNVEVDPPTMTFTCTAPAANSFTIISFNRQTTRLVQNHDKVSTTLTCAANGQWQVAGEHITEIGCNVVPLDIPVVIENNARRPCDMAGPQVVIEPGLGTDFESIAHNVEVDPPTMTFTCTAPAANSFTIISFNRQTTRLVQNHDKVSTTLTCAANGQWQVAGEHITEIGCNVVPLDIPVVIENNARRPCDMAGPQVVIEPGLGTDFESIAHNVEVDPPTMTFTCTAPAANSFTIISFNRQTTRLVQNHDKVSTTLTCAANGQWQVAGEHITEIGCNVVPLDIPVVIENNARRPCDMAGPQVVIEPGLGTDFESIAHNVEVDPPTMTLTCTAPAANSFTIISFNRQTTRLVQNHDKVSTTLTCAANGQWQVAGEHITEIGCNVVPLDIPVVIENNARRPCDMAGPQVVIEPGLGTDFESIAHNVEVDPPTMTFTCTAPAANSFTIISFNRQTTRLVQNHDKVSTTLTCAANGQWQVAGEHITEIGCNVVPLDIPVVIENNARRPCDMAGPQVVIEPGLGTDFESIAHNVEVDPPTMTFTCTAPAANSFTIISFNRQTTRLVQNHDKVSTTLTCAANGQWQVAGEHITEIGCNVVPLDIPVVIENNARRPCDMAGPQVVIEPGLGTDFESIAHNVEVDPPTMTLTCTAPAANSFTIISFNRQTTRLVQNHDKVSTTLTCAANGQWQVAGEHITEIGCNVVPLDIPVVIENNARRPCDMAGPQVVIESGLGTDFESIAHNVEVDPPTMTFTCTAPAANSFTIISFNRQTTRLVQSHDKVSTTLTCAANGQWQVAGEHITEIGCNVVPLDIPVVIENNARRPCDMAGPQVVIEPGLGTDFESIAHNVEVDPPTMTLTCTAPAANSFTIISFNRQTTRLVQNHDTVSTTLTCAANGQWQVAGEHITEIGCNVVPLDIPVVIENNARRPCDMAGPQVVIEPGLGTDFEFIAHNVEVDPPTMTFTCTAPAGNSFVIISFNRQKTRLAQNHDTVSTTLTCAANGQWQVAGEHITEIGCLVFPAEFI